MKSIAFITLILFPVFGVYGQNKNEIPPQSQSSTTPKVLSTDMLTYSIFSVNRTQFGFDIFQNKKLLIHQPQIPGIPGNKGFVTSEEAEKVATLVIEKIRKGIFPPTVTIDELENLKIKIE